MQQNEFSWTTSDKLSIYGKEWAIDKPKAVICIVHGLGEHCNRYNHVAAFFNKNGYAVLGYDRRGHGQSDGPRGGTPSYAAFLDEVDVLLAEANKRYPNTDRIIWGHSMGGNISLTHVIERNPAIKALVTTGAWMKLVEEPPKLLMTIGKFLNKLTGGFTQSNKLEPHKVSRDKVEVQKYIDDPLVHNRISSIAGVQTYEKGLRLLHFKGKLPVPTLLMHGEMDQLISVESSRAFSKNASGDITYKEWAGLYHEIHNDPEKEEVLAYALEWMEGI